MHRSELGHLLRFGTVGVVGFLVDVGVLYAVAGCLGWYGARVVSFLSAATVTWLLNKRFSFSAGVRNLKGAASQTRYVSFVLGMLIGAMVNWLVYIGFVALVAMPGAAAAGVALGSLSGMYFNFFFCKKMRFFE